MKENSTLIVVILDRSGSMCNIKYDMEGGFNEFIRTQAQDPGECLVTLSQFDTGLPQVVYQNLDVNKVPPLTLEPRGSTALLDAIGFTIDTVGNHLAAKPEELRPSKVAFLVITDGHENASREYSQAAIQQKIKHQRDKYAWEFIFLGADEKAIATAQSYGIFNSAAYTADAGGSKALFASVGSAIRGYKSGELLDYNQVSYNAAVEADKTEIKIGS